MQEGYYGGGSGHYKKMSKKQIEEMIKNMNKTKIINKKSNEYHKQEEKDADNILNTIQSFEK